MRERVHMLRETDPPGLGLVGIVEAMELEAGAPKDVVDRVMGT
jgi:hypothetical protein